MKHLNPSYTSDPILVAPVSELWERLDQLSSHILQDELKCKEGSPVSVRQTQIVSLKAILGELEKAYQLAASVSTDPIFKIYKHDCPYCKFLGSVKMGSDHYDMYFCDNQVDQKTVIARYSGKAPDYMSGLGSSLPPLILAQQLAKDRGLV